MAVSPLQSNSTDLRIMLKLLVAQLADVLGDRIVVERAGGRFRKSDEIKSVQITLGRRHPAGRSRRSHGAVQYRARLGGYPHPQRAGGHGRLAYPPPSHSAQRSRPQRADAARPREHCDRRAIVTDCECLSLQDLPKDAAHRLEELEHGLFTSDLSVNEFLLVKEAGFHPLGFVMGSSIYHIGLQTRKWGESQELTKLTEAMYTARELAMNRMEEEATELGADGVVGVRLDVNYYEWGNDSAEFIAFGTAVKAEDGNSYRNAQGKPFTSDLSGQDFWTLMQTGHVPQGLVMGTCVYHIAHRKLTQALGSVGQNVELPNFTQALYEARELAMTRMQDEAGQLNASGIVGVRLEEKSHQWGSHTIEFLALGHRGDQDAPARSRCPSRSPSSRSTTDERLTATRQLARSSRSSGSAPRVVRLFLGPHGARLRGLPGPGPPACGPGAGVLCHAVGLVRAGVGLHARAQPLCGRAAEQRGYTETYRCPHGYVSNEHRMWGQNVEQTWVEEAWSEGYGSAYGRMLEEATSHRRPRRDRRGGPGDQPGRHGNDRVPFPGHRDQGRRTARPRRAGCRGPPTWRGSG